MTDDESSDAPSSDVPESYEHPSYAERLAAMQVRHRALDDEIVQLEAQPWQDQLQLRRLKKEKLRLKDLMRQLRTLLIPDLNA
jgi:hypothetical protein